MCITYLLESQGSDLLIVVNIPILIENFADLLGVLDAVIYMRGLILWLAWGEMELAVPPVVSFNLGSFGFLTSHTVSFLTQLLSFVIVLIISS